MTAIGQRLVTARMTARNITPQQLAEEFEAIHGRLPDTIDTGVEQLTTVGRCGCGKILFAECNLWAWIDDTGYQCFACMATEARR